MAEIIAERYALLEFRGDNGLSRSYLVEDLLLQRRAFMKIFPLLEETGLEYLKAVTLARDMGIPSLLLPEEAGILDDDDGDPVIYALYPELNEPSLERYLALGFEMSGPEALRISRKVLECLEEMHCRGLLHLFVNPRNVLYRPSGEVLLKDACLRGGFLPVVVERLVRPEVSFFSPRLMDGMAPGPSDDLHAAGLLFRWLSGYTLPGPERKLLDELSDHLLSAADGRNIEPGFLAETLGLLDEGRKGMTCHCGIDGKETPSTTGSIDFPFVGKVAKKPEDEVGRDRLDASCVAEDVAPLEYGSWRPEEIEPRMRERGSDRGPAFPTGPGRDAGKRLSFGRLVRVVIPVCLLIAALLALGSLSFVRHGRRGTSLVEALSSADAGIEGPVVPEGEATRVSGAIEDHGSGGTPALTPPGEGELASGEGEDAGASSASAREPASGTGMVGGGDASGVKVPATSDGKAANRPPVASFTLSPGGGPSPLRVLCDASGSYDPDGRIVAWRWSFGLEGKQVYWVAESQVLPARVPVTLTVTDDAGASATTTMYVVLY